MHLAPARLVVKVVDDYGDFPVLEVPHPLRESVDIGSFGGTQNPTLYGCGRIGTTKSTVG